MLASRPCKIVIKISTVWNQHVQYYQSERDIDEPDMHAILIADLCTALGDLRNLGNLVVLGIDSNDNVRNGSISAALADIGIKKVVINNHCGESVPVTCSKTNYGSQLIVFGHLQDLRSYVVASFPSIVCMVLTQTID